MFLGLIKIIGVGAFLYLTWRNLYDDYQDDKLISYTWLTMFVVLCVGRLTYGIINWGEWNDSLWNWLWLWEKPGFNIVGGIVGAVVFSGWYALVNNWKLWPFFEDITPSILLFLSFFGAENYVKSGYQLKDLYLMLIPFVGYLMSNFIARKYRSFVWYKSGKKGFVFFFISFLCGLMLAGVSLIYSEGLPALISYLSLSLISVVGLAMLGEVFHNNH